MKEIILTKGKVALVDDEDYDRVNQLSWFASKYHGETYYAKRVEYPNGAKGKKKYIKMHRFILEIDDPKIIVDHKDHNGLNNQKENIRICTQSQNGMNRTPRGKSKYLGVCWDKQKSKWLATIRTKNRKAFIGYFDSEVQAGLAYNREAKKHHKEFANLNKI